MLIGGFSAITATLVLAAPAAAVPEGWSSPDDVNPVMAAFVIVGGPLALALLIAAAVYVPALVRGEQIGRPGAPTVENQWLGGPRRSAAELAGPDSEGSQAGGASARW